MKSRGNKDQSGLSYHLLYRETICAPASSEHAQSTTFGLLVEASLFILTDWFHIHFFYLSKHPLIGVSDTEISARSPWYDWGREKVASDL